MKYTKSSIVLFSAYATSLLFLSGCSVWRKKKQSPVETTHDKTIEQFPLVSKSSVEHYSTEFDPAIESFVLKSDALTSAYKPASTAQAPIDIAFTEPQTIDVIHFDYDSDKISANEQAKLATVVAEANATNNPIVLRGHACLYSPAATSGYNLVLSQRRGGAVEEKLIKEGVQAGRITVIGLGNEEPISTIMTKDAQAVNRRVEITMVQA